MLKVKVNPNYKGKGWLDPKSDIFFSKEKDVIHVGEEKDKTNINRYINLNYLMIVEKKKPEKDYQEPVDNIITKTPKELLSVGLEEEAEEVVEKPKYNINELKKKKYSEVQGLAKELGLNAGGKKIEIIDRIISS